MRLSRLVCKDWLGIAEADIDLTRPVTWVFGANGSGKSSVAEALRFLLTRTARGTDAAGRGAAQLVRDGSKCADLHLTFATGEFIGARISGSSVEWKCGAKGGVFTGAAVAQIVRDLFGPPELLRCLVDAGRVLDLSGKEQSDLLSGLLGEGCTLAELEAHARKAQMPEPAIAALLEGISGRLPRGSGVVTPGVLKDGYKGAYEARAGANARLKGLRANPVEAPMANAPVPSEEEISAARDLLAQADRDAGAVREEIGALGASVRALEGLRAEHARATSDLAALPAVPAPAQGSLGLAPDLGELQAAASEALNGEQTANAASAKAASDVVHAKAEADAVAALIGQVKAGEVACPSIHAPAVCPISQAGLEQQQAALPKMQAALGKARAAEAAAVKERDGRAKLWQSAAAKLTEANAALRTAQLAAAKAVGAGDAKRAGLETRVADLARKIEAAGDPASERAAKEQQLMELGRTKAEANHLLESKEWVAKAADAHREYAAQLWAAEEDVAIYVALCDALEPRGLPLAILSEKIDPFLARVNAVLIQLAPYSIDIDTSDGLQLLVTPSEGGSARSPVLISESERLRVGAALSLALALTSGLRFCVLDRLDALLPDVRNQLLGAVEGLGSEMESVVLICSASAPPFEADAETGVYWVEGGLCNSVEALGYTQKTDR